MEPAPIPRLTRIPIGSAARAFTLIEMMVVLAIISVISVVILVGQSSFDQSLILKDTSYSIEYSIRQAQTFGLSNTKTVAGTDTAYGINFNAGTPDRYTFFADTDKTLGVPGAYCNVGTSGQPDAKPGDCRYKPGSDTVLSTTKFTHNFSISNICVKSTSQVVYCFNQGSSPLQNLDIVFARPNLQAIMSASTTAGFIGQVQCAVIVVQAPTGGVTNMIRISQFGEISLNQTCP